MASTACCRRPDVNMYESKFGSVSLLYIFMPNPHKRRPTLHNPYRPETMLLLLLLVLPLGLSLLRVATLFAV